MKKTYAESWFIIAQPFSDTAKALCSSVSYYNAGKTKYEKESTPSNRKIVILQTEVQPSDSIMFEVMYSEDYYSYVKGLSNETISELKERLRQKEDSINDLEIKIDRLINENKSLVRTKNELSKFNEEFADKLKNIIRKISYLGELEVGKDEWGTIRYYLREDIEIDKELYDELTALYTEAGCRDLIVPPYPADLEKMGGVY